MTSIMAIERCRRTKANTIRTHIMTTAVHADGGGDAFKLRYSFFFCFFNHHFFSFVAGTHINTNDLKKKKKRGCASSTADFTPCPLLLSTIQCDISWPSDKKSDTAVPTSLQKHVSTTTSQIKCMWNSRTRRVGLRVFTLLMLTHSQSGWRPDRSFNVKHSSCCCHTFILMQI